MEIPIQRFTRNWLIHLPDIHCRSLPVQSLHRFAVHLIQPKQSQFVHFQAIRQFFRINHYSQIKQEINQLQ
jgi:hypothetical protein